MDSNYINLVHGFSNTRVYKIEHEYFCYTANRTAILPYATKSIRNMANYLFDKLDDEKIQVELMFGYEKGSLSKIKQKKLKKLLKSSDVDIDTLIKWVTML
jgi:hypothetical protein